MRDLIVIADPDNWGPTRTLLEPCTSMNEHGSNTVRTCTNTVRTGYEPETNHVPACAQSDVVEDPLAAA